MVLTKDFKDNIKDRVARDSAFREELLKEDIECLLTGDLITGRVNIIPKSIQLIAGKTGREYNQRKNRKGVFWEAIEIGIEPR